MKNLFSIFTALLSVGLYADVQCAFVDGTIVCSGSGDGTVTSDNVLGLCTNCVNMTPESCALAKSYILQYVQNTYTAIADAKAFVTDSEYSKIPEQLESFFYGNPQSVYDTGLYGSLNATQKRIYKPEFDAIKSTVDTFFTEMPEQIDNIYDKVTYIQGVAENGITCSECPALSSLPIHIEGVTNTVVVTNVVGGSDSPGTGGGSSGCPCSEQITALRNVLTNIGGVVDYISDNVNSIKETFDDLMELLSNWKESHISNLEDLNELVSRIDDYVEDDQKQIITRIRDDLGELTNQVARLDLGKITAAILVISNDVDSVQKKWFQRNATATGLNLDGEPLQNVTVSSNVLASVFGSGFNSSLYSQYNWFARVELLLAKIAGVGSSTDFEKSVSDTALKNVREGLDDLGDSITPSSSLQNNVQSLKNNLTTVTTSLVNFWPDTSPNTSGIQLLPAGTVFFNQGLSVKVPIEVQNYCHYATTLVFSVVALVIGVHLSVFAFNFTCRMLAWYFLTLLKMFS